MINDRVDKLIEYSAVAVAGGVELRVTRESITFVRETIPDGQMAGMIGHRPVEHVEEMTYTLHPDQARALHEELGRALEQRRGSGR